MGSLCEVLVGFLAYKCSVGSSGMVWWFVAFTWLVFLLVALIRHCSFGFVFGGLVVSVLSFSFSVFGVVPVVVFGLWHCFDSLRLLFVGFWLVFVRLVGGWHSMWMFIVCSPFVFVFLWFFFFF